MKSRTLLSFVLASLCVASCSSSEVVFDVPPDAPRANRVADAAPSAPDAVPTFVLPSWSLEDIQPQSPQFGQVYGLNAFPEKILVAVLVEGF